MNYNFANTRYNVWAKIALMPMVLKNVDLPEAFEPVINAPFIIKFKGIRNRVF